MRGMAGNYCPECGGVLFYDALARRYVCKSCGLYATKDELQEIRDRLKKDWGEERRRKRERSEYLDWWLTSKKG